VGNVDELHEAIFPVFVHVTVAVTGMGLPLMSFPCHSEYPGSHENDAVRPSLDVAKLPCSGTVRPGQDTGWQVGSIAFSVSGSPVNTQLVVAPVATQFFTIF